MGESREQAEPVTEEVAVGEGAPADLRLVVTNRDRELMALLGLCRYLTTDQANRLLRPGRHESGGRRRLHQLAGLPPTRTRAGRRAGATGLFCPPFLRRLRARAVSGVRLDFWTLEPRGHGLAMELLGEVRKLPGADVGEAFLEHWAAVTEVFVALAAPLLRSGVAPRHLPFRWVPEDAAAALPWAEWDRAAGVERARRLLPDAMVEVAPARKRWLIECEMGTHSIVAASDEKAGATVSKAARYDAFFAPRAGGARGYYAEAFPDGWDAEVVFLVRDYGRAARVNAALAHWANGERKNVAMRAVTHDELVTELVAALPEEVRIYAAPAGAAAPPARGGAPSPVAAAPGVLDGEALAVLRRYYNDSLAHIRAGAGSGTAVSREFLELARECQRILQRLGARPDTSAQTSVAP